MSSKATHTQWQIPKTVLGNKINWDVSKIPGRKSGTWSGKDDQLWRCRKTKRFEASFLKNLPHGASFVDAGAHFGDTVITMAIYARDTLLRKDIRFVAFEPNPTKARFIEECAEANGFDQSTLRVISCVLGDETLIGAARVMKNDASDFCQFDGRTSYEVVAPPKSEVCNDEMQQHDLSACGDVLISSAMDQNGENHDDDDRSCSSSSTSSSLSSNLEYTVHRLDDFLEEIYPLGFLHIDVEGWEAKVLSGASALLTGTTPETPNTVQSSDNKVSAGPCYIFAETFSPREARRRGPGFSLTHEEDIMAVMAKYPEFSRGDDVVDGERNLFFVRERQESS